MPDQAPSVPNDPYSAQEQALGGPVDPYAGYDQQAAPPADPYAGGGFHTQNVMAQPPADPNAWATGPMPPAAAPQSPYAFGPGPAPGSFGEPKSKKVPILIGVSALLGVLLIIVNVVGFLNTSSLTEDRDQLKTAQTSRENAEKAKAEKDDADLKAEFTKADLQKKRDTVRSADALADTAADKFLGGSIGVTTMAIVVVVCDEAVADYNYNAARFPDSMRASLPLKLDIASSEADCGRAGMTRVG